MKTQKTDTLKRNLSKKEKEAIRKATLNLW